MRVHTTVSTGSNAIGSSSISHYGMCLTPPDNPINIQTPHGPDRLLEMLFTRWNPAGKNQMGRTTEEEVAEWVEGLIKGQEPFEQREAFYLQTRPLGWRLIGLLNRFGIKSLLLPDDEYEKRFGGDSTGIYIKNSKLIAIQDSALFCSQSSTLIHEFGHAIDHMLSSLCSGGYAVSTKLWHWFAPTRTSFVSTYAETHPKEYLAESLEAYFLKSKNSELQQGDPSMYNFLDNLIILSST